MAGRQRGPLPPPPHPVILVEDHRLLRRAPPPAAALEDRITANHREIQVLLQDNQQLAATHVALKQDLALADDEIRQLVAIARKVREERESEVKEVYERSMNMEAQVRGIDTMNAELVQVRTDVKKLTEDKIQLTAKFKAIDAELARVKQEVTEVPAIRDEIESMRQELQKGRAAIEFEKKTRAANLEQSRSMERSMITTQREIERLRAELANAEKRARAAAAAAAAANPNLGYMGGYGNPSMAFGGSPYPVQYPMHQAQSIPNGAPSAPYGPPASSHGSFDMQQSHLPKGDYERDWERESRERDRHDEGHWRHRSTSRDRNGDHRKRDGQSWSPERRRDDDREESKKDDGTDHLDPEIARANRIRASLGLKPLKL